MKAWKPTQKNKNQNKKTSSQNKNTTIKKTTNHPLNNKTPLIIQTQPTESKTSLIKKIGNIFSALLPIMIVLGLLYTVLFIFFPNAFAQIGKFGQGIVDKTKDLGQGAINKTNEIIYYIYDGTKDLAKNGLNLSDTAAHIFAVIAPALALIGVGLLCLAIPVVGPFIGKPLILMGATYFLKNLFFPPNNTPPSNKIPPTEIKRIEKEDETTKKFNPTERS
ncbi:hypothetical protein [Poinsettia branch-inducing phytoplasma]|uniref:hypothetical protein n=1 Tax=Poinsettia branch-inducing phytoplasma TaxID=138647 RepID=UPI00037D1A9E|nr:hypothetical protein [Poinsettia branch-inducing phytoplasma]